MKKVRETKNKILSVGQTSEFRRLVNTVNTGLRHEAFTALPLSPSVCQCGPCHRQSVSVVRVTVSLSVWPVSPPVCQCGPWHRQSASVVRVTACWSVCVARVTASRSVWPVMGVPVSPSVGHCGRCHHQSVNVAGDGRSCVTASRSVWPVMERCWSIGRYRWCAGGEGSLGAGC